MAPRIKWIADKSEDYRGNHSCFRFKLDNSPMVFTWCAHMTYKSFKSLCRRFAQHYGATSVTITPDEMEYHEDFLADPHRMSVLDLSTFDEDGNWINQFKFRKEQIVPEGTLRQFKYYTEDEIFPNQ